MKLTTYLRSVPPLVALAVLAIAAAAPDPPAGTALLAGPVLVNGRPTSGPSLTLASGDRLETGARGGAILSISRQDGLVVSENSALTLVRRPDGVAAELNRGRVLVNSSHDRLRELRLAGEPVSIRAAPGMPRRYQVSRLRHATYVLARAGTISIFDEVSNTQTDVLEGRAAVIQLADFPMPPSGETVRGLRSRAAGAAGFISAAIPKTAKAGKTTPSASRVTLLSTTLPSVATEALSSPPFPPPGPPFPRPGPPFPPPSPSVP